MVVPPFSNIHFTFVFRVKMDVAEWMLIPAPWETWVQNRCGLHTSPENGCPIGCGFRTPQAKMSYFVLGFGTT